MKADIHPDTTKGAFRCACGYESELTTTNKSGNVEVEICSQCHPFFTGKQRFVDTAGRIDRFRKKYANLEAGAGKKKKGK